MATAWRRPIPARERVLFYGGGGVGKTMAALMMAAKMLGPEDRLYVIDYDNAVSTILQAGRVEGLTVAEEWKRGKKIWSSPDDTGNVIIMHGREWEDLAWMLPITDTATYDSVVLVDSISWLWDGVQNWYIQTVHGDEMADWLLDMKRRQMAESKDKSQAEGAVALMQDGAWQLINKQWTRFVKLPLLVDGDFHVIITAEAKTLRMQGSDRGKDSEELAGMYRHVGEKPNAQKSTAHNVATVVHLTKGKTEEAKRFWTCVKDWGYEEQGLADGDEYEDMARALLWGKHGWRPRKVD